MPMPNGNGVKRRMATKLEELQILITAKTAGLRQGLAEVKQRLGETDREVKRTTSSVTKTIKSIPSPKIKTRELSKGLADVDLKVKRTTTSVTKSLSSITKTMDAAGSTISTIRGAKGVGGAVSSLKSLVPVAGAASSSLSGLGSSAAGAGTALGATAAGVGLVIAALGIAAVGIGKASQEAVKFESALGRVNMQLKGNTRGYMEWATSMGLAKSTAADMGATYSVLLSSFTADNSKLAEQTKQMVQTTRVVASATGRTIQDTTERIRSGLLGNTEAIEDLGIFVNVSMIESTKAFKQFANGKSWEQLNFKVQQQIRLAAIMEQAYDRYGNTLQAYVMTKQTMLSEQLKDIKLNLSQAFLPIWEVILPALSDLATAVAYITEQLARFSYWMAGKDYEKATMGLNNQTTAATGAAGSYDDLNKSAKDAQKTIAGFDRLNVLNGGNGGTGKGNGGSGGGGGLPTPSGGNKKPAWEVPDLAAAFSKRYRIEFDPPNPPDAGAGGVATAVDGTINSLIANTKAKLGQMWADIQAQTQVAQTLVTGQWSNWLNGLLAILPGFTGAASGQWGALWTGLQAQTSQGATAVQGGIGSMVAAIIGQLQQARVGITAEWQLTLDTMQAKLNEYRPYLEYGLSLIGTALTNLRMPLATLRTDWHTTFDTMQVQLNKYRPYLEYGLSLLSLSLLSPIPSLIDLGSAWELGLSAMYSTAGRYLDGIVDKINAVVSAFQNMTQMLGGFVSGISNGLSNAANTVKSTVSSAASGVKDWATASLPSVSGLGSLFSSLFSGENFKNMGDYIGKEAQNPGNQVIAGVAGSALTGGALSGLGAASKLGQAGQSIKKLFEALKDFGIAVPAFANGAMVYGPTMAMVGDNKRAVSDPEVVSPLSTLNSMIAANINLQPVVEALYLLIDSVENQETTMEMDGDKVARILRNKIRAEDSRIGRAGVTIGGVPVG